MTDDIEAFRAQLQAAGQPWSRYGVRTIMAGFGGSLLTLIGSSYVPFLFAVRLPLFVASLTVIAGGWVFMIMAMRKRAQWAKTEALQTLDVVADESLSGKDAPGAR